MFDKKVLLWGLYDFANSILVGNMSLYFVQYVVVDKGLPDIIFSITLTLASIILLFLAPSIGILIDSGTRKIKLIRIFSFLILVGGISLGLIQHAIILLAFFLLATVAYQSSIVPYNTILIDVSERKKRGIVSGFGELCNWSGYLLGLIITLPIINGTFNIFGQGRQGVFIPATLLFFILGLPFLLFHKEEIKQKRKVKLFNGFKELFKLFKKYKGATIFLLIYFLANNAAATFITFGPLYFEVTEGIPDQSKVLLTAITLGFAAIGAFIGGRLNDKYGSYFIMSRVVLFWAIALILVILGSGFWYLVPFTIIIGFLMGSFWSNGRKFLTDLVPEEDIGRFFGLYSLSIRMSAILGPPLWSLTALIFKNTGDDRYRFSMLSLALLLIISYFFLRKFKNLLKHNIC